MQASPLSPGQAGPCRFLHYPQAKQVAVSLEAKQTHDKTKTKTVHNVMGDNQQRPRGQNKYYILKYVVRVRSVSLGSAGMLNMQEYGQMERCG